MLLLSYKKDKEGELSKKRSKIVNFKTLSKVSKKLQLHKYINTGKSIKLINEKIMSDCYESLIGAIFIDSNLDYAEKFIKRTLLNKIENYETEMNHKGTLIEICLKEKQSDPIFKTLYCKKNKKFKSTIKIKSINIECFSYSHNRKEAEKECSRVALEKVAVFTQKN